MGRGLFREQPGTRAPEPEEYQRGVGLYTILPSPILYGVWNTKEGSVRGCILPNSRAIVLQQCGQCKRAGRMQGRLIRAQTTISKRISCKAQHPIGHSRRLVLSPFKILQCRLLCGVWHTKEGSVGGCILRNGRAIVLQ